MVDLRSATRRPAWLVPAVAAALGVLALIGAMVSRPDTPMDVYADYQMGGVSMEPTIAAGERVQARTGGGEVHRGDIVVVDHTWSGGGGLSIKRVVAVGGDTVACCDPRGRLRVNGRSIDEDYLNSDTKDEPRARTEFSAAVPAGRVFLAGDNRANSMDSRVYVEVSDQQASVPLSAIKGIVVRTATGPVRPTDAFANAGLGDARAGDEPTRTWMVMLWVGVGLLALGVGWYLVSLTVFARRRDQPVAV